MKQHQLAPSPGSRRVSRRVGRGDGSGRGNYSGRGMKGQNSRSGGGVRPNFAGGQLPLSKALPMLRGFTNIFRIEYAEVNLEKLTTFPKGSHITPLELKEAGILKNLKHPVKILGRGILEHPVSIAAHRFSKTARAAIEAAGGTVKEL